MMKGLRDKYNTSMLMITHDLGIVAEICDEVSVVYAGRVIEHGTLEDIFKNTRHPYTEGLFNSLPNLENRQAELKPIKGLMPDPAEGMRVLPEMRVCDGDLQDAEAAEDVPERYPLCGVPPVQQRQHP